MVQGITADGPVEISTIDRDNQVAGEKSNVVGDFYFSERTKEGFDILLEKDIRKGYLRRKE